MVSWYFDGFCFPLIEKHFRSLYVPDSERGNVILFKMCHGNKTSGHLGITKRLARSDSVLLAGITKGCAPEPEGRILFLNDRHEENR